MKTRQITAWVVAGVVMSTVFTSCKKEDNTVTLPSVDGFNASNDVAAANLVAHWPFEGNNNERKSSTAPSESKNASFTTGASGKGQALSLAAGYLYYPEIAALNTANGLQNFSVSAWVNVKNNKVAGGDHPTMFFTLPRADDWIGNINLMSETGRYSADKDTLVVKGLLSQKLANGDASNQDSVNDPSKGGDQAFKGAGKWSHIVITYDGAASMFLVYANGKKISNPEWEQRGTTGPLNLRTPSRALIGAFGTNLPGRTADTWQQTMTGQLDELRVYNKALTSGEISSLYQLELQGR